MAGGFGSWAGLLRFGGGACGKGPLQIGTGFPVNIPAQLEKRLLHFCVFLFRLPDGAEHGAAKRFFPVKECVPVVEAVEGSEFLMDNRDFRESVNKLGGTGDAGGNVAVMRVR